MSKEPTVKMPTEFWLLAGSLTQAWASTQEGERTEDQVYYAYQAFVKMLADDFVGRAKV